MKFSLPITLALGLLMPTIAASQDQCDPFAVELATTPVPPDSPSALRAARAVIASMPEQADLLLIGDSIFQGWRRGVEDSFPGRTAWNFSVGGDKTQHALWRFAQIGTPRFAPRQTLIFIGNNNLGVRDSSGCSIFAGIKAIIDETRSLWPDTQIFVVSIPPRGVDFRQFDTVRLDLNAQIASHAAELDYTPVVLDDFAFTCGGYAQGPLPVNTAACYPENAYKCGNYRPDNLHFETAGYQFLRQTLRDTSFAIFGRDLLD